MKAVENDDSADRDNSRRNASGDEDAHGRNPLIGAMHLDRQVKLRKTEHGPVGGDGPGIADVADFGTGQQTRAR